MRKSASEKRRRQLLQHDQYFLNQGFSSLAGVDEAGRGPLAGPVVASAVIVRDFSFSCRVDDSKAMTAGERHSAYGEILERCDVGVGIVGPGSVDRVNILQATLLAMRQAVMNLSRPPDCVLVDGRETPRLPHLQIRIVNGDALSFSIACASVVAKVVRDSLMDYYDGIYPDYGFSRHKGYGTAAHLEALKRKGPCGIHRRSFAPLRGATSWKLS